MIILGVNPLFFDTSACVLVDGKVAAAVQEERLSREKRTTRFPEQAIRWCLKSAGLTIDDIDEVALPVNAGIYLERLVRAQAEPLRYRGELLYSVPAFLISLRPGARVSETEQRFAFEGGGETRLAWVRHHLAHAASSFYPSPFEDAALLAVDAFGEKDCVLTGVGRGTSIGILATQEFPHSLGSFYATLTELLGFKPYSEEWKVMGASAYGDPAPYLKTLRDCFELRDDGGFELDLSFFNFFNFHRPLSFALKLEQALGGRRHPDEPMTERHFAIASATQRVTEEVLLHMMRALAHQTGLASLCVSGGVFLNSVMNGKILEQTPFRDLYVPCAPDDTGTAIGAALARNYAHTPGSPRHRIDSPFFGPSYTNAEIEAELVLARARYRLVDDPAAEAARLIAAGRVVGWHQGALEFGDRALGHRSILADPRDASMKDRLNREVKHREEFRPFAPAVPAERAADWFEGAAVSPFMDRVYPVRPDRRATIPAVTHVDGSARLQTVRHESDPLFQSLIERFGALTGVPVVLNTSFNVQGEPIVCSPKDALRTFASCGMNALVMGPFVLEKS